MENCNLVQVWVFFKLGVVSFSIDSIVVGSFVYIGNNGSQKSFNELEEERRKMVNVMELFRGFIFGVYLCKFLKIFRIIWRKFVCGWEKSMRLFFNNFIKILFLQLVCYNLGKWIIFKFLMF